MIFTEVDIDFSKINITSVIGQWHSDIRRSNGSGKSALLEAIPYALFGITRTKTKHDIIKRGAEDCEVVLTFELNGKVIEVTRYRSKTGTKCLVQIDGVKQTDQVRDSEEVIVSLLGIDSKLFDLIYFFRQNDQFGFLNSTPSERKSHLSKIFDMSIWDKCQDTARKRYDVILKKVTSIEGMIQGAESVLTQFKPVDELNDIIYDKFHNIVSVNDIINLTENEIKEYTDYLDTILKFKYEIEGLILSTKNEFNKLKDKHDHLIKQITDLKKSVASSNVYSSQLKAQRNERKEKIGQFKQDQTREQLTKLLNEQKRKYTDLRKQSNDLIIRRDTITTFLNQVEKNEGNICPECGQEVSSLYVFGVKDKFKSELIDVKNKIKILEDSLKQVEKEVEKLNKYISNIDYIIGYQKQIDDLDCNIKEETKRCKDFTKQIDDLEEEYSSVALELSKYKNPVIVNDRFVNFINNVNHVSSKISKIIEESKKVLNEYNGIINSNKVEVASLEKQIKDYFEIQNKIENYKNEIKLLNNDLKIYKELINIFGKTGVQAIIIENVLGIIENFSNSILSKMQTSFIIRFKTVKQIQSGSERETLDILVFDNGIERSIETYSGGERTIINLSIRLALSKVLSSLYEVDVRSIFLDEVLAALDEINRDEAVKMIRFLSSSFTQVFVISHEDRVKDIIPNGILVKRYSGHSVAELQ